MSYEEIRRNQEETNKILTDLEKKQEEKSNKIDSLLDQQKNEEDFEL